jgi:hypothetical protein
LRNKDKRPEVVWRILGGGPTPAPRRASV